MLTLRDLQHIRRFCGALIREQVTAERVDQWTFDLGEAASRSEAVFRTLRRLGDWKTDRIIDAVNSMNPHHERLTSGKTPEWWFATSYLVDLMPEHLRFDVTVGDDHEQQRRLLDGLDYLIAAQMSEAA